MAGLPEPVPAGESPVGEALRRMGHGLAAGLPKGWSVVALVVRPRGEPDMLDCDLLHSFDDKLAAHGVLVRYLLAQSPASVLLAFELERRAKIAHELGVPMDTSDLHYG